MARKPLKYRDSMLDELLPHLEKLYKDIGSYAGVAEEAEVSPTCIADWINHKTRHPRSDTLGKVAAACGLEFRLIRIGSNTGEVVEFPRRQYGRSR